MEIAIICNTRDSEWKSGVIYLPLYMARHIAIIGNGISGVTAARHIRKRDKKCRITIISSETKYFFSRTALMYVYMGHMKFQHTKPYEDSFWPKNRIELKYARVDVILFEHRELVLSDGEKMPYDELILALGSVPNSFDWPGENLKGVQGLYSCQDLLKMEEDTHDIEHAVVVGGGLIGVEMVEMLLSRNIKTTFLIRDDRFWGNVLPKGEAQMIHKHMHEHHVDLRFNTSLKEIIGDEHGRVKEISTQNNETIPAQFVGLTVGVRPNIDFLKNSDLNINRGIVVDQFLETNQKNVYAIGDCAEFAQPAPGRRAIEQVWYTGRMMGEAVAKTITGERTKYSPGHWFNSAKFFDIEYQTYGYVPPEEVRGLETFYWEHMSDYKALRVVYESEDKKLVGVSAYGIRLRHELLDRWFNEGREVDYFMSHYRDVNFDPEFFELYYDEIASRFKEFSGLAVDPKPRSWKRIFQV